MSKLQSQDPSEAKISIMIDHIKEMFVLHKELGFNDSNELLMYLMSASMQVLYQIGGDSAVDEYCDKTKEMYKEANMTDKRVLH